MSVTALARNASRLTPVLTRWERAEPWPHYFDYRLSEWEVILGLAGSYMRPGLWLDIGSGNSATTALLTSETDGYRAVGVDLPVQSWTTHSYGPSLHRELWNCVGSRPPFAWASAGALPFRSEAFDGIFSSYSLQYVSPHAGPAFAEMYRVLRTGGVAILVLPTLGERVSAMSAMWLQLSSRVLQLLSRRGTARSVQSALPFGPPARVDGSWRRFRRNFPRFPLPSADAPFRSFQQELRDYRPAAWRKHAMAAGFSIRRMGTTSFTLRAMSQWVVAPWRVHRATRDLMIRLQRSSAMRLALSHLGESVLIVLQK